MFYVRFINYFVGNVCFIYGFLNYVLLGTCSEALSLTRPLRKDLSTEWSWSGSGLKRFALQW